MWPRDETNAIFLAPWCFAKNYKYKFWEQKNFTIAFSPWKTPGDILQASLYIDSLIDKLVPLLSRFMNNFHGVKYSERFWKIYTLEWLSHWLGHSYDRYQRLKHLPQTINEKLMVKILKSNHSYSFTDCTDYMRKITAGHYYNLLLMSDIIRHAKFDFLVIEEIDIPFEINENKDGIVSLRVSNSEAKITKMIIKYLRPIKRIIIDRLNSSLYLGAINGISMLDRLFFQFFYDPLFIFKKIDTGNLTEIKKERSKLVNQVFEFGAQNNFEKIVEATILNYIPNARINIYSRKGTNNIRTKIWIGNDIYRSEKYAFRIAEICEQGGRWISVQHGGGYGQTFSFPFGKLEYETSGEFITWGWNFKHIYNSNYYPLPSPMLSKLPQHRQSKEQLIYVGSMETPYPKRLYCDMQPGEIIDYLQNKILFLSHLKKGVFYKIKYVPYFYDYGIGELEFLGRLLSSSQFFLKYNIVREFQSSKLVVIDHRSTSFLQTFAMNVPTILFWNPVHFSVTPFAELYFDKLRSAGILFDTPEGAAEKVNEIWDNVQGWWQKLEVQKAKDEFCHHFAFTSKNWRREWLQFFKRLRIKE